MQMPHATPLPCVMLKALLMCFLSFKMPALSALAFRTARHCMCRWSAVPPRSVAQADHPTAFMGARAVVGLPPAAAARAATTTTAPVSSALLSVSDGHEPFGSGHAHTALKSSVPPAGAGPSRSALSPSAPSQPRLRHRLRLQLSRTAWAQRGPLAQRTTRMMAADLTLPRRTILGIRHRIVHIWKTQCMSNKGVGRPASRRETRAQMEMSQTATPSALGSENAATSDLTRATGNRPNYGTRLGTLEACYHHSSFSAHAQSQTVIERMA